MLDELEVFFKFDPPLNDSTYRQWETAFTGFADSELHRASQLAIKNHKWKNAPLPAAIIEWLRIDRDDRRGKQGSSLDDRKWVFGEDEEGRPLAWHPDMRDEDGKPYEQLTKEQIERAHPKLAPGGKAAAMAFVKGLAAKVNQQRKEAK